MKAQAGSELGVAHAGFLGSGFSSPPHAPQPAPPSSTAWARPCGASGPRVALPASPGHELRYICVKRRGLHRSVKIG